MSNDWDDLTPDDLVTQEDLQDTVSDAIEAALGDDSDNSDSHEAHEHDGDGGSFDIDSDTIADHLPDDVVTHDEASEMAERKFLDGLEHIVNDDCDTESCNQIREQLGIDPSSDESDGGYADSGSEDTDEGEDTETKDETNERTPW